MIVKLLTEHHLEFLSLKGGCRGLSESTHVRIYTCQNATLLEISCTGSFYYNLIIETKPSGRHLKSPLFNCKTELSRV